MLFRVGVKFFLDQVGTLNVKIVAFHLKIHMLFCGIV